MNEQEKTREENTATRGEPRALRPGARDPNARRSPEVSPNVPPGSRPELGPAGLKVQAIRDFG